jgi:uncharacterized membrane protein YcaP (DUF421 family)
MEAGRGMQGPEAVFMDHWLPMQSLTDMFALPVPIVEKILRAIVVYIFLIFALKFWGKRVMAQLNPFDLVVLLILSNTVQNAIIGNDNSVSGGLIGAVALLLFNNFVVRRLYGHARLEKWVEGKPDLLIEHGKLREEILKRDGVSKHEVVMAAHKQGFDSLNDVEKAVLAPGGGLWFFRHTPTTDESRQTELLARLDRIEKLISARTPPVAG